MNFKIQTIYGLDNPMLEEYLSKTCMKEGDNYILDVKYLAELKLFMDEIPKYKNSPFDVWTPTRCLIDFNNETITLEDSEL